MATQSLALTSIVAVGSASIHNVEVTTFASGSSLSAGHKLIEY